eukprot:CAMPEP_0182453968 /NCGR_PEP_ID=MMETSP1319-20130603/796_1 /TAXON_ID=172717 /ORGANISM="Bolidomonas pacifica, Strain RCC208" /LENGTH=132 /DNA_ID=CAMNT_0024651931 /DNA_START=167 /DNA_END=565 /DNA_ORIENTATION=+
MALNLYQKQLGSSSPVTTLYRSILRELPAVLGIYDIDMDKREAVRGVKTHFLKNGFVADPRVKDMLVQKGYMELEETLMQWKQKAQLMRVFEGQDTTKFRGKVDVERGHVTVQEEFEAANGKKGKREGVRVL